MVVIISSVSVKRGTDRPVAEFHPSRWGDQFLDYTPDDEVICAQEEEIKALEEKVREKLLETWKKPLEQLRFIDAIARLGVAYHFDGELENILQQIYNTYSSHELAYEDDDLFHTSLRLRLLRQHGFYISSDVLKKFMDAKGNFKNTLIGDVEGLLSLYEASHVSIDGEEIMDEAFVFSQSQLKSIATHLSGNMAKRVKHALDQPLHRGMTRLESRYYISMYEHDPSHNKILLHFAKVDFNYVQSLHKMELKEIGSWWQSILSSYKFARDRLAEAYFWTIGAFYEPQYALGRKIFAKIFFLASIIDDIYDAYGVYEELVTFTEAIQRWHVSESSKLPDYMKFVYEKLLDAFVEFEHDLAAEGRSYLVDYVKEQKIILCETYMQEAKWRKEKCIPPCDEYLHNCGISFGYDMATLVCFLGMGEMATREAFEWVRQRPAAVIAAGVLGRIKNDMGGNKFQHKREHVVSAVECYMKLKDVSEEEAREELNKQVEDAWKVINKGMLPPHPIPWPLLARILELCRAVDVIYKGEDAYTNVSERMRKKVALVFVDEVQI